MSFIIEKAKNNENTLKLNGKYIYSKYSPREDANLFVKNHINISSKGYIIFGLGLGYHLEALLLYAKEKPIIVVTLYKEELLIFNKYSDLRKPNNVELVHYKDINFNINLNYQIIIPNPFIKALDNNHPLFNALEDLKILQLSINSYGELLFENYFENIKHNDPTVCNFKKNNTHRVGCLISAGPSLIENIADLKKIAESTYILCVGSALKTLLKNKITPNAVIITDPQETIINQLKGLDYKGKLLYLSTANYKTVNYYKNERFIIFQKDFPLAEQKALSEKYCLIETGGSVATTAFSILEFMGMEKIILFGQDLGFSGDNTHVEDSSSNIFINNKINYKTVINNNGELINTTSNLETYARWFERKVKNTSVEVYNTALKGRKIAGIPYIDSKTLLEFIFNGD